MIEILVLWSVCKHIGKVMRDKGRNALGYQILTPVLYIVGALSAGLLRAIYLLSTGMPAAEFATSEAGLTDYVFTLVGGGLGLFFTVSLAKWARPAYRAASLVTEQQLSTLNGDIGARVTYGQNPYNINNDAWVRREPLEAQSSQQVNINSCGASPEMPAKCLSSTAGEFAARAPGGQTRGHHDGAQKRSFDIVRCAACRMRVIPKHNGKCPSCQSSLTTDIA